MAEWIKAADSSDVKEGRGFRVRINGQDIALFRHKGKVYAYENACPHQGAPLHQSHILDGNIVCMYHGWQFNVESGDFFNNDLIKLKSFPVKENDTIIFISVWTSIYIDDIIWTGYGFEIYSEIIGT